MMPNLPARSMGSTESGGQHQTPYWQGETATKQTFGGSNFVVRHKIIGSGFCALGTNLVFRGKIKAHFTLE